MALRKRLCCGECTHRWGRRWGGAPARVTAACCGARRLVRKENSGLIDHLLHGGTQPGAAPWPQRQQVIQEGKINIYINEQIQTSIKKGDTAEGNKHGEEKWGKHAGQRAEGCAGMTLLPRSGQQKTAKQPRCIKTTFPGSIIVLMREGKLQT